MIVKPGEFLTAEQVADLLHVHANTIYRWIRNLDLPATKVGRKWLVRRTDLDAWLATERAA